VVRVGIDVTEPGRLHLSAGCAWDGDHSEVACFIIGDGDAGTSEIQTPAQRQVDAFVLNAVRSLWDLDHRTVVGGGGIDPNAHALELDKGTLGQEFRCTSAPADSSAIGERSGVGYVRGDVAAGVVLPDDVDAISGCSRCGVVEIEFRCHSLSCESCIAGN